MLKGARFLDDYVREIIVRDVFIRRYLLEPRYRANMLFYFKLHPSQASRLDVLFHRNPSRGKAVRKAIRNMLIGAALIRFGIDSRATSIYSSLSQLEKLLTAKSIRFAIARN